MGKKGTLFFAGSKATPPQRGLVQLVYINIVVTRPYWDVLCTLLFRVAKSIIDCCSPMQSGSSSATSQARW